MMEQLVPPQRIHHSNPQAEPCAYQLELWRK